MKICRICGSECKMNYDLRGTMYGAIGRYTYTVCDSCGCMQIASIPKDLSKYYSVDKYYSLNMDKRRLKNTLLYLQLKNQIKQKNLLGALTQFLYPVDYSCFNLIDKDASLLDIGCGDGELLRWLAKAGFRDIEGIDPYATDLICKDYQIYASDIREFKTEKKYDMITMFHVLEHLDDQQAIIDKAISFLKSSGYIVIMIPFFSKYYWTKYGDTLYTLDPPRHLYLHTKKSMLYLFEKKGMTLKYFSTELDPGIPEMAANIMAGRTENNNGSTFIKSSIVSLISKGLRKKLKKEEDGAIATFIFEK